VKHFLDFLFLPGRPFLPFGYFCICRRPSFIPALIQVLSCSCTLVFRFAVPSRFVAPARPFVATFSFFSFLDDQSHCPQLFFLHARILAPALLCYALYLRPLRSQGPEVRDSQLRRAYTFSLISCGGGIPLLKSLRLNPRRCCGVLSLDSFCDLELTSQVLGIRVCPLIPSTFFLGVVFFRRPRTFRCASPSSFVYADPSCPALCCAIAVRDSDCLFVY